MRRLLTLALLGFVLMTLALSGVSRHSRAGSGGWSDFEAFLQEGDNATHYEQFRLYLESEGVAEVAPAWTLWRQGSDWAGVGEPAFAVPPPGQWAEIVPTLRCLRDVVVPTVGPVTVVSGWRTSGYNAKAGGAKASRHLRFQAVDVIPERAWQRDLLHLALLDLWKREGPRWKWGLGLYSATRFHVDTGRHRRW